MTVTRDAHLPAEIGQLFQAFNRAADGHTSDVVFQAAANLVVAAINYHAVDPAAAIRIAEQFARQLPDLVRNQHERSAGPGDVEVPLRGQ